MNKQVAALLLLILLAAGGFYWYTTSGEVLNEPAPERTENNLATEEKTPNPLLNSRSMRNLLPDEPQNEPELPKETQGKIDEMVTKAQTTIMADEEKKTMSEESVTMMKPAEETTAPAEVSMLSDAEMTERFVSRQGMFTEIDLIHKGSGLALIYPETAEGPTLRLENFSVTRGPDLHVYLSRNADIKTEADLDMESFYDLGPLKSSKGNQNYQLPSNHEGFKSVVIWCKAFGVLFSSATLQP